MKKIKSAVIAVMLIVSLCVPVRAAGIFADVPVSGGNIDVSAVISDRLNNCLEKADEDELISVTIELADNIDMEKVERLAVSRADISTAGMAIMNMDTSSFSEEVNEAHQEVMTELRDKISAERNEILKEHYSGKNAAFISSVGLSEEQYGSVGILTPFIREVLLTPAQIQKIACNPNVCYIDYVGGDEGRDLASVDDTYQIINGNVSVESGYKGSGIRVGMIETGFPKLSVMGSDSQNIVKIGSGTETEHATKVCGIIKKMAPSCSIYSYAVSSPSDVIDDCSRLIYYYNVHVVNISYGGSDDGKYNSYSREMDRLVAATGVPVVIASGNGAPATNYVNVFGLSPNAITVGAVTSAGKNQGATGAYMLANYSIYRESSGTVNKPDICAPGKVKIYSYDESEGTSFAAAHVTGTVVQMMSRNSVLQGRAQTVKAAIMASASYNAGTSMSYVTGTKASNQEGAGVIDAGFCYNVARYGRGMRYNASSGTESFTYTVSCDSTTVPFRIACAWEAITDGSSTKITDYDMRVYKNGTLITTSNAYANSSSKPNANYEIIELSTSILGTYGAGSYQVEIKRVGTYNGSEDTKIGLAWGQR